MAIAAPQGIALASEANITVTAGSNHDQAIAKDNNLSVGQHLRMRVGQSLSIFVQQLGMKLIAAAGKIRILAQSGDIEIGAAKKLHLYALEEIVLDAPKITLRAQNAGAEYGGGITTRTSGAHTQHAASHAMDGPASVSPQNALHAGKADFDQKIQLSWHGSGDPIANRHYRLRLEDGRVLEGKTNASGQAEQLQSAIGFARYKVELLPEQS